MQTDPETVPQNEPPTASPAVAPQPQVVYQQAPPPQVVVQQSAPQIVMVKSGKSRGLAVVLALFLGGIGMHHFYLGNVMRGLLYVLFCWTLIPGLIALVEAIKWALLSDDAFQTKVVAVAH